MVWIWSFYSKWLFWLFISACMKKVDHLPSETNQPFLISWNWKRKCYVLIIESYVCANECSKLFTSKKWRHPIPICVRNSKKKSLFSITLVDFIQHQFRSWDSTWYVLDGRFWSNNQSFSSTFRKRFVSVSLFFFSLHVIHFPASGISFWIGNIPSVNIMCTMISAAVHAKTF